MRSTRLTSRLSSLPLVLAGPLLRRVEPDGVTVWVALREAGTVKLTVFTTDGSATMPAFDGERRTVRLGERLHVCAVTANPEGGESNLLPESLCLYDLDFGGGQTLESAGVLDPIDTPEAERLKPGYADHGYPSFVLPAPDERRLRLIHGSCRKPHGPGREMLSWLDLLLADSIAPLAAAGAPSGRP